MTYDQLYPIFECAHQNNEPPKTWYENNIMRSLQPKKTSTGILGTLFFESLFMNKGTQLLCISQYKICIY